VVHATPAPPAAQADTCREQVPLCEGGLALRVGYACTGSKGEVKLRRNGRDDWTAEVI